MQTKQCKGAPISLSQFPHQREQTAQAKVILCFQTPFKVAFSFCQGVSQFPWNQIAEIPPFPRVFPKCFGKYCSHYSFQFSLYDDP